MNLPFNLPFKQKVKTEYFLALILRDEKINAVVFEEIEGKIKVIGEHQEFFPDIIENTSYDNLLDLIDKTVSKAEENLPEGIETEKTIFGVKADWVNEAQIKKDHLITLKKICDRLGLSPIGFLVIPEAISHLLSKEEGAPISGLLTEIGKKNITISIVRAGRVLETKKAKIEDSIPKTTDRILHHFTNHEILPSRIIVFDCAHQENLQQEFISFSWSKSLPFLHVPQITILPKRFEAKAILFGAATQMGFDMLLEEELTTPHKKFHTEPSAISKNTNDESIEGKAYESPDIISEEETESTTNDFGFVVNGDIEKVDTTNASHAVKIESKMPSLLEPLDTLQDGENFTVPRTAASEEPHYDSNEEKRLSSAHTVMSSFISALPIAPISHFLRKGKLPSFIQIPTLSGGKKPLFILGGIIIFLIGLYAAYSYIFSATITIVVNPKQIDETKTITFSTTSNSDFANNIIAAETTTIEQEGSLSTPTSGKKEIGEKAKGTVTIYNSSLAEGRNFPKGTPISAPNGLDFLLDSDVKVASASGDASSITSSTAKISVSAKDIGKESNLPSGTKFTIGSIASTSIIAKNDSAFSGGTKKEVTVVSKKDQDTLAAELPKKLEEEAKTKITSSISEDKELLPNYFTTTLAKKTYDKKLEEEAKELTLQATVEYEGLAYTKNDLLQLFKSYFEKDSTLSLSEKSITYDVAKIEKAKNGDAQVTMNIKTSLLPKINNDQLALDLKGQSFEKAKETIQNISQVADVQISSFPSIPFLPNILPRMTKNIHINVQINE